MTTVPTTQAKPRPFDRVVGLMIMLILGLIGVVIWRGDQRQGTSAEPSRWQTGGIQVVYSEIDANGKEQLFLAAAQLDAPKGEAVAPLQLTRLNNSLWDFAVAPDSSRVVFSALKEDGTSDLWSISPGEQEPTLLIGCPNAVCSSVAWSADGRFLAFSRRNATEFSTPVLSPPRLWIFDVTSGESLPAFADDQKLAFEPRWSADGQWLSYVSPDLGGVGVYNRQSGQEQFYASTTGEAAIWHPQRNEVLLTVAQPLSDTFVTHMLLIDPVNNTQSNLSGADNLVEDGSPAWSPAGAWVALRRKEFTGPGATPGKQLWLMRANGSEARALTAEAGFDFGAPLWSPDGRYLLFHKLPLKGPEITLSVWIMTLESGQSWEVARPGQRPQWLP